MTTIAWDGKTLAADTQLTMSGVDVGTTTKIIKLSGKIYIATAGYHAQTGIFKDWILGGEPQDKKPEVSDDFAAFKLTNTGLFEYDFLLYPMEVTNRCAIGSGWEWAMAAMDHGDDAEQAVKYASTRDVFTNSLVQTIQATT